MTVFYIIVAILLFGILIFVHELGHFTAAKCSGVRVNEFSLFMGPALWKKQKGDTLYALRCIPIGGYCSMEGESEESDDPRAFSKASVWKRFVILVAGSLSNFLIGFVMTLVIVAFGFQIIPTTEIAGIQEGRPFAAVLQEGDRIHAVDGRRVYVSDDVTLLLDRDADGVHDLVIIRDGEKITLNDVDLARDYVSEEGKALYGFSLKVEEKNLWNVLSYSFNESVNFGRMVWMTLGDLFRGQAAVSEVSGVVGIVGAVAEVGTQSESVGLGLLNVLYLFAFIAINLGVMNLLPIPALDGGRVVCLLVTAAAEKILRRKIDPKYEMYLHGVFMVLLMLLMAVLVFKDVIFLFK